MSENRKRRVRLVIRGIVQGVSFRYYTRREANRLGISGWVRNRSDGSVEVEAQGSESALDAFTSWCHDGPSIAVVQSVSEEDLAPSTEKVEFEIRF